VRDGFVSLARSGAIEPRHIEKPAARKELITGRADGIHDLDEMTRSQSFGSSSSPRGVDGEDQPFLAQHREHVGTKTT